MLENFMKYIEDFQTFYVANEQICSTLIIWHAFRIKAITQIDTQTAVYLHNLMKRLNYGQSISHPKAGHGSPLRRRFRSYSATLTQSGLRVLYVFQRLLTLFDVQVALTNLQLWKFIAIHTCRLGIRTVNHWKRSNRPPTGLTFLYTNKTEK